MVSGNQTGQVGMLRVHDVGTGFGPPTDFIDVEAVTTLQGIPGAFGFELRDDGNAPVRTGMLNLLRDAYNNGWTVTISYNLADSTRQNGVIFRLWLSK